MADAADHCMRSIPTVATGCFWRLWAGKVSKVGGHKKPGAHSALAFPLPLSGISCVNSGRANHADRASESDFALWRLTYLSSLTDFPDQALISQVGNIAQFLYAFSASRIRYIELRQLRQLGAALCVAFFDHNALNYVNVMSFM